MPYQPSNSQVHVDRPLTNISVGYEQNAAMFVASRVAPVIPVQKRSDSYFIYNRGDFYRDEMKERAPGTESAGSGWNLTTDTYNCKVWALHKDIPDQIRDNADDPLNFERDATIFLTQKALIRKDKIFAAFMTTGVWTATGSDGTPGTKWNSANSTPIAELRAGMTAVQSTTGYRPNTLVLSQAVWDALADNTDLTNRVNQGQTPGGPAIVQARHLAAILEIPQVLIMGGVENTAQEGATASTSFIAGNDSGALLAYVEPNPGIMKPSALYTFAWTGHLGANAMGGRITTQRIDPRNSDRVEIEMAIDIKQVAADMGYYIQNVLTT